MAVKLIEILKNETRTAEEEKHVIASLFADQKSDVVDGMKVDGLPSTYVLQAASTVRTANFEVGTLDSDGVWHWAGEEE